MTLRALIIAIVLIPALSQASSCMDYEKDVANQRIIQVEAAYRQGKISENVRELLLETIRSQLIAAAAMCSQIRN